ncbi:MAG TPA: TonB-dependent receptor [Salinimicrobium catena]|uniref:TonB-dependent receptor n=1 Tax=Salinimicrobium catena TaxID=390640 RepID=A0A7C2M1X8_9FLAO|nr:TonB-dependent receptor [Salinimicrobium catena]
MKKRLSGILTLLLVLVVQISFAQQKQVTGNVIDEEGLPLPGVNVVVKGTSNGTTTDFNGDYSISAAEGQTLVFSYVGFLPQEKLIGAENEIDVVLNLDAGTLEEVVVVGYGTATKQSFTGTATKVDGELLDRKNVSDVSQALAGEAAGVRVINTSGQPGTEATIRIRGIGSVNGNRDPLFVVDGVPFNGNISSINPADIESTTILKDAAATSIYGARGANGVIVITTKDGSRSGSFVEVELKTGQNFQLLPRYSTIESPERYIELAYESVANEGQYAYESDPAAWAEAYLFHDRYGINNRYNIWGVPVSELIDPATGQVREGVERLYDPEDWEDYGYQASTRTEANLRMSGGNEKSTYYASMGYLKDVGYIVNSDYERYSARLNITHEVKDWLSGSMDLGYALSESNQNGQSEDSGSIFWFSDNIPSIYPLFLRDENGEIVPDPIFGGNQYDYGVGRGFGALTNAIADAHYDVNQTIRHEINANTSLTATLADGLTFETRFGLQYFNDSDDIQNNPFYGSAAGQNGSIFKRKIERFSYNFLQLLRYRKSFGDHSLEAFVAHEANSWEQKLMSASMSNLVVANGLELNNGVVSTPPSSYTNDYTLESYFGQINYDFDDKYFLSGTVRRDGSSRFLGDNKWGTFGAVGAAWVLSNEDFLADQNTLSNLKLKASYGLIGEQAGVGFYPGYDLFSVNNLNGGLSLIFDTKGNPDLTWETSKMFQTGVEFGLGKYLDASVDYYVKNTDDLLFERRVAPSVGYAILNVNDGKLRNTGVEFDVTGHIISQKDLFLDLSINGEIVQNELLEMPIEPATGEPKLLDIAGYYGRAEGHSIYDFYLREWAGVDPETGVAQWNLYFNDANSNGVLDTGEQRIASLYEYLNENPENEGNVAQTTTTSYSQATQKFVGKSAVPDVRGAFNLATGYKGFTLSAQFLYQLGGYSYDFVYARLMHNDMVGSNNWHTDILNRWQEPGDITDVPRLSNNADINVSSASTRFLTKSDFLSLNNVRLGYTVPAAYTENIGVSNLSIYVSGDNLMLLSERDGFNPSVSEAGESDWYTYSPLSTVTAGVKVKF